MHSVGFWLFMLTSFTAEKKSEIPPKKLTPLEKMQSVVQDAYFYKDHQKLSFEETITNLTEFPGTFAPENRKTKFGSDEEAGKLIKNILESNQQEITLLTQQIHEAKKDERFKKNHEEFKKFCTQAKQIATFKMLGSGSLGVLSALYLIKHPQTTLQKPLIGGVLAGGTFTLVNFLEKVRYEQYEHQLIRKDNIEQFETKLLTNLEEKLTKQ